VWFKYKPTATSKKKLDYGRWHTQDIDKVCVAASVFVKEQKPIGLDGCFISYVLCIDYSLSCGMELCIPSIQTLLFNSFPMDYVPSKGVFGWYDCGGILMVWRNSKEICEIKTLFQIKKETNQIGFKGTGTEPKFP